MTTTVDTQEIEKVISDPSSPRFGSDNCGRDVYLVGGLVVKRWGYYEEMENYRRISAILAECDTYDGITFALPHMEQVTVKDEKITVCERIDGLPHMPCPERYDAPECPPDPICSRKVSSLAQKHFDLFDMHFANYIVKDSVVYMVDIEY